MKIHAYVIFIKGNKSAVQLPCLQETRLKAQTASAVNLGFFVDPLSSLIAKLINTRIRINPVRRK